MMLRIQIKTSIIEKVWLDSGDFISLN